MQFVQRSESVGNRFLYRQSRSTLQSSPTKLEKTLSVERRGSRRQDAFWPRHDRNSSDQYANPSCTAAEPHRPRGVPSERILKLLLTKFEISARVAILSCILLLH